MPAGGFRANDDFRRRRTFLDLFLFKRHLSEKTASGHSGYGENGVGFQGLPNTKYTV